MCTCGGTDSQPPWTAEHPKIDWRVSCVIDFVSSTFVPLAPGRLASAARRKTLGSTDRRRARGLELAVEQRGRARTRSADSCAMASISRTNYHAALGRSLVAITRTRSLKIWESGLGQRNDYRQ